MANYHLNISYGRVGKGGPHIDYILGQNKYSNKQNEIEYTDHNLPIWSKSPKEFWIAADDKERTNGTVYKEIRISLPNELSKEKNIELLNEFINIILEGKYHYSIAIHSKESSYKTEILNTHAHIMFSPRELDVIERNKDIFFKRFNAKSPELGGCKKNTSWNNIEKLLEIRKIWENIQNKYLENENIDERVSCETLEKQRKIALENEDHILAKYLDREPVTIDGYLLKKSKNRLNKNDRNKIEYFNLAREMKELSDEVLKLERQEAQNFLEKQKIKNIDLELESLEKNIFKDILKEHERLEKINIEILKVEYELLSSFSMEKNRLEELILLLKTLNDDKSILETSLDKFENTIENEDFKKYVEEVSKVDFNTKFNIFNQSNYEIKKAERILKNIPNQLKNLETTSLNILTKGNYLKLKKSLEANELKLSRYQTNFNYKLGNENELEFFKKEIKRLSSINKNISVEIEKIKSDYFTPEMKNKKIRIEKSIEQKLLKETRNQELLLIDRKITVEILRKTLFKGSQTQITQYLSNRCDEGLKINLKASKSFEVYNYFKEMKFEEIERLALNYLSKGIYLKTLREYKVLNEKIINLEIEKNSYEKLSKKLFNLRSLSRINKNLKNMNLSLLELEKTFKTIQNEISSDDLYREIIRIRKLRDNIADKHFKQNTMYKEQLKLNEFFIKQTNNLKKELEKDVSNRFRKNILKENYIALRGKILGNYLIDFEIEKNKKKTFELDF